MSFYLKFYVAPIAITPDLLKQNKTKIQELKNAAQTFMEAYKACAGGCDQNITKDILITQNSTVSASQTLVKLVQELFAFTANQHSKSDTKITKPLQSKRNQITKFTLAAELKKH